MTPKEKAIELFDQHFEYVQALTSQGQIDNAKECALITVDEIVYGLKNFLDFLYKKQDLTSDEYAIYENLIEYYKLVKTEIKKITL